MEEKCAGHPHRMSAPADTLVKQRCGRRGASRLGPLGGGGGGGRGESGHFPRKWKPFPRSPRGDLLALAACVVLLPRARGPRDRSQQAVCFLPVS